MNTLSTPETLEIRARYLSLASALVGYPDDTACATAMDIKELPAPETAAQACLEAMREPSSRTSLRHAYIDLFDRGKGRTSLYESEYGRMRGAAKGQTLADVAGFYRAFGLSLAPDVADALDHIAIELEFYALLLTKEAALSRASDDEGVEIVRDARAAFLREHLGAFANALASSASAQGHTIYGPLFRWTADLVTHECTDLGVEAARLDYFASDSEQNDAECGASDQLIPSLRGPRQAQKGDPLTHD